MKTNILLALTSLVVLGSQADVIKPVFETAPVSSDADDPAIWVHPTDPKQSLIIGTDKVEKTGGLYVFDFEGREVQHIENLDRPNNVDVVQNIDLGGGPVDLAICTERMKERLKVYRIDAATQQLTDVSGQTGVFADRQGEGRAPMGIAIYRRSATEAFVVVSPKTGPTDGHLGLYRLKSGAAGTVDVEFVRYFGKFSGEGEIEALVVDSARGMVFAADEGAGIRSYQLETDAAASMPEMSFFGREDYQGDREGMAIVRRDGRTLLVSSDQIEGGSRLQVFDVTSGPRRVAVIPTVSDETDGLELTQTSLDSRFPDGALVMMNSGKRTFLVYDLREIGAQIK